MADHLLSVLCLETCGLDKFISDIQMYRWPSHLLLWHTITQTVSVQIYSTWYHTNCSCKEHYSLHFLTFLILWSIFFHCCLLLLHQCTLQNFHCGTADGISHLILSYLMILFPFTVSVALQSRIEAVCACNLDTSEPSRKGALCQVHQFKAVQGAHTHTDAAK